MTVDKLATDTAGNTVEASRCRPAKLVEDAHTRAEHALYSALWNLGGAPDCQDPYRETSPLGMTKWPLWSEPRKGP
jgi:hypothetical protein